MTVRSSLHRTSGYCESVFADSMYAFLTPSGIPSGEVLIEKSFEYSAE